MKHIPSNELTLDQIPDPNSATEEELRNFAHSFNPYIHWGDPKKTAEAMANAAKHQKTVLNNRGMFLLGCYPEPEMDYLRSDLFIEMCSQQLYCGNYPQEFWDGVRGSVRYARLLLGKQNLRFPLNHIPSNELTLDQIPDPETATNGELWAFAPSFNAYAHWDSVEKANEAIDRAAAYQEALENFPESGEGAYPEPQMDYLRTVLFMDCRAQRFCSQEEPEPHFWKDLREGVRVVQRLLERQ